VTGEELGELWVWPSLSIDDRDQFVPGIQWKLEASAIGE
jgi:hypothetical protein